MSTFFNSRFPSIGLNGSVIQILLYPCAKFLELVLPDWGVSVWGVRHSLNPGPWNFKEQMFAVSFSSHQSNYFQKLTSYVRQTITYNIAIYTTNSYGMILVQKSPVFYGEKFVTFGYQLMLTLFVQLMGMGFAGYLRRFSVSFMTRWSFLPLQSFGEQSCCGRSAVFKNKGSNIGPFL